MSKLIFCTFFFVLLVYNRLSAQQYCFWVANYSDDTFSTLQLRETGEDYFGSDVLPDNLIQPGEVFWIKPSASGSEVFDIQITKLSGAPLRFKWTGEDGNSYNEPYITLNVKEIHTLVLTSDEYGNLAWDISYEDIFDLGHPCDQD